MIKKLIKKVKYELRFNNTQYYTRISDKVLKGWYRSVLEKKINLLPPIHTVETNAQLTLSILANKKNFYESIAALYSFCFWNKDIYINYHEDGTLSEQEITILKKIFPGITIFRRKLQDATVVNYLLSKGYIKSAELRRNFILSLKLFDTIVEKKTPYLLLIDSDVLFFSQPKNIIDIVEKAILNGCYNKDVNSAYCFSDEIFNKYLDHPIIDKFNSGVFLHNLNKDCFEFIETVLKQELRLPASWHLEQTLFAMYATHKGGFEALPKCYDLARKERNLGNFIISEHYVHNTGYDIHKDFIYKLCPIYLKN
ncbi:hypothetical protein [Mucilaginibacter sp.]|uniref:hypothetical protein n=1 Tax=Mucilaginibacter sp. TaxID=1882438 RepID=UPI0026144940|nr:hypothetical protein [Mucilaginibacter sp.]MDB4926975.1 hypothetical protein [Mucilaginibacter sp.]